MGYDGSLKFDTSIDEKGFNSGVKKLGSIAKGGVGLVTKAVAASTAALGAGIAMGVKYNAEMENFFTDFKVMLGSAEEATKFVNDLKEMAAKTPFEMTDLANASKILLAFGSDAQSAQEQIKMLGDISLGNAEKMKTLSTAFGRIQSNGRASLEEINMMIDIGFNPLNLIAQKTGESMDELRKRVSEGGVSFEEIADAMETATSKGGQFYNGMEEASKTLTGQLSTLKDNVNNLLGEMTKGYTDNLTNNLVPAAIDAVNKMTEAFESGGFEGLIIVGAEIIGNLLQGMISKQAENVVVVANFLKGIVESVISYAPVLLSEGYNILKNIIDGFVEAIPEQLPKILDFIQGIGEKLAEFAPILVQKGFELIGKLVEGIVTAIPILIEKVPTIVSTFANIINDNFPVILMKGVQIIGQLIMGLIQAIPTLVANIPKIIAAIVNVITAFQWLSLGKNIIKFFGNGIGSMKDFVKAKGKEILKAIENEIRNLPSNLMKLGKAAASGLGNAIRSGIGLARNAASSIVSTIVSTISSIPGKMLSIGRNIVQGIWNGISGMTGWIIKKISGFASGVVGSIKNFFGIHSPSTLMRDEVGKYLAQGVGVGFVKNIPVRSMTSSMKKAIGNMKMSAMSITTEPISTTSYQPGYYTRNNNDSILPIAYALMKLADRPIESNLYVDKNVMARTIVKPLTQEQRRMEKTLSRKGGVRQWGYT